MISVVLPAAIVPAGTEKQPSNEKETEKVDNGF
jgi:hypothetical protein